MYGYKPVWNLRGRKGKYHLRQRQNRSICGSVQMLDPSTGAIWEDLRGEDKCKRCARVLISLPKEEA